MAIHDPADQARLRMEQRRFVAKCDAQISLIERADTLRELSRLSTLVTVPFTLSDNYAATDALRLVHLRAEDRAREIISEDIQKFIRGDEHLRNKLKRTMAEGWTNLTGPLGHLRTWAQSKLTAAEIQNPVQSGF